MSISIVNHFLSSVFTADNRTGQPYITKKGFPYVKFSIALGKDKGFLPCTSFNTSIVDKLRVFEGQNNKGITVTMTGTLSNVEAMYAPGKGKYAQFVADTIEIFTMNGVRADGSPYTSIHKAKSQQEMVDKKLREAYITQDDLQTNLDKDDDLTELDWDIPADIAKNVEIAKGNNGLPSDKIKICLICNKNFVEHYEDQLLCNICQNEKVQQQTPQVEIEKAQVEMDDQISLDNLGRENE